MGGLPEDVTDTIKMALKASGCDQAVVRPKPRLLRDNGTRYISGGMAGRAENEAHSRCALRPVSR